MADTSETYTKQVVYRATSSDVAFVFLAHSYACDVAKPWISFKDQVAKQKNEHGLIIVDEKDFQKFLSRNNYYRFTGYGRCFQYQTNDGGYRYKEGVTDQDVRAVYELDAKLRHLLTEALAPLEILIRTRLVYALAQGFNSDPESYLKANSYSSNRFESVPEWCRLLKKDAHDTKVLAIKHNMDKYGVVPLWVAAEQFSFGTVSKMFSGWRSVRTQEEIAQRFNGISVDELRQLLRSLVFLRNICFHHGRVWNRRFDNVPVFRPKSSVALVEEIQVIHSPVAQIQMLLQWSSDLTDANYRKRVSDMVNDPILRAGLFYPKL